MKEKEEIRMNDLTSKIAMILDFYEEGKIPLIIKIRLILRQIRRKIYEYRNITKLDRIRRD